MHLFARCPQGTSDRWFETFIVAAMILSHIAAAAMSFAVSKKNTSITPSCRCLWCCIPVLVVLHPGYLGGPVGRWGMCQSNRPMAPCSVPRQDELQQQLRQEKRSRGIVCFLFVRLAQDGWPPKHPGDVENESSLFLELWYPYWKMKVYEGWRITNWKKEPKLASWIITSTSRHVRNPKMNTNEQFMQGQFLSHFQLIFLYQSGDVQLPANAVLLSLQLWTHYIYVNLCIHNCTYYGHLIWSTLLGNSTHMCYIYILYNYINIL